MLRLGFLLLAKLVEILPDTFLPSAPVVILAHQVGLIQWLACIHVQYLFFLQLVVHLFDLHHLRLLELSAAFEEVATVLHD